MGLTVRIGAVFLVLMVIVIAAGQSQDWLSHGQQPLIWLVVLVAVAFGGLLTLRAGRVPGQIEAELLRAGGDARRWREVRPMIGTGPIVDAWNTLLEQLDARLPEPTLESSLPSQSPAPVGVADGQTALMARTMRSVSAGIAVSDPNFQVLSANGPLAALFALPSSKELMRRNILESLGEIALQEDRDNLTALDRLRGGGHQVTVRLQIRKPDAPQANPAHGSGLAVRGTKPAEVGDHGSSTSDHSTGEPIAHTDAGQEEAHRTIRVSRSRLSGREGDTPGFAWLIQDVTQQTLAAKARDEFLHTATHELRTPLANLRAYAEALSIEEGVSVEEQKEFCNIIMDETNRLSRLVDHLLTVGQMEAGSLVVQSHRLNTARIIEEAIDNIRPQIAAAGLELETAISPKLRAIRGDKEKLQAVLVNLIGNAVKYTPRGGRVQVGAVLVGDWLEVNVQDTGIGISAEDQPKVFEKFFRVESDAVREQTGNGLGLAFAREVARLHQGDITLKSTLGEGSVFTLRLPAPDEPEAL